MICWPVKRCLSCGSIMEETERGSPRCPGCQGIHYRESWYHPITPAGHCVYCGKPLLPLMEACLNCGNQP